LLNTVLSEHTILVMLLPGLGSMDKDVGDWTGHSRDLSLNLSFVHRHEIVCTLSHLPHV